MIVVHRPPQTLELPLYPPLPFLFVFCSFGAGGVLSLFVCFFFFPKNQPSFFFTKPVISLFQSVKGQKSQGNALEPFWSQKICLGLFPCLKILHMSHVSYVVWMVASFVVCSLFSVFLTILVEGEGERENIATVSVSSQAMDPKASRPVPSPCSPRLPPLPSLLVGRMMRTWKSMNLTSTSNPSLTCLT